MLHKDILQQLFPVALGGVFPIDLAIEGDHLDQAREGSAALLYELFPDQATELLSDWERVCGLTPDDTETPQSRRQRVVAQLRSVGRMDQAYYIELAAELGYTITIEELAANTDGYEDEGIFRWRVTVDGDAPEYYFEAGVSCAGDPLLSWASQTALEGVFEDLKPAHTQVIFAYT